MLFKHKNVGTGIITIYDSKKNHYALRPGEEVIIDREAKEAVPYNIIVVEKIKEQEEKVLEDSKTELKNKTKNKEVKIK